jgi:predicted extracellular nuclease
MAAFTPGNIVIYRVGTGSAALGSAATAVFLDEYTPSGTLVQSIALPTADSGANQTLTASGTSTSEGLLTLSTDGHYLVLAGYDAAVGTAGITTSASATINRVVARVGADGSIDTTTALSDFSTGSSPRGVASTNGTDLWVSGGAGGVRYTTLGSHTSTQLSTTVTNIRGVEIFNGQLYASDSSGTSVRLGTVGSGLPTTSGQTISNLPGFPTAGSPHGFFFADLTASVPGLDTVYVADDGGTLQKYSLVSGTWASNGTVTAAGIRGLTGSVSGTTVNLYMTSASQLSAFADASGYNGALSGSITSLATASANTAFRGVAFAPQAAVVLPTLSIDDVTHTEGNAGTVTYTFTVSLSAASAGAVTFNIATADGTATTADGDYVAKSLTSQTIAAGLTTYTFDVTVNSDTAVEPTETFLVNVTNVSGATVGDGQGQGTITNDDFPPVPTASVGDASIIEGQSGVSYLSFTVTLSFAPTSTVTVDFATADGTATAGSDYLAVAGTVSFAAGQTTQTFLVPVIGDVVAEANETLTVNLTNPTGATLADAQGVGTITNDDASAYFPLASGNFSENWTDTSRITANDNWSGVTSIVGYLGDTDPAGAVTGVDPRTITGPNLGQVDVIANLANTSSTSGGVGEFEIANPTIGLQGSGTADAPSIVLYMDASGRQDIHLTATLRDIDGGADDAAQQVNVQYRTSPGGTWTNVPGGYFADVTTGGSATQETSLDVILPAGANNSPTLEIRIMTTNAAGSDEWVGIDDINVSSVQGPASYSVSDAAVFEGTGTTTPISFTVSRAGDTSAAGTVDYAVTFPGGGFSANAADIASPLTGSVSFNAGETSKILTLNLVADSNPEADEAFTVTLSNPSAGGLLGDSSGTGTIVNDDGAPPFVTISDISQIEGNSGTSSFTFTVTRTGGTGAFTVDYATANGTATTADGDYVATSGTLSFAAGENSKQISVTVNGDTAGEFNETFSVSLSNPTGFAVLADSSGSATIVNDDIIPIYMVQGSGMTSPFAGQSVRTQGIVTAIDSNGYYLQDPNGDGNSATSDGVFVFTSAAPTGVAIGDMIQVTGTVTEFVAGAGALSVTEIASPTALSVLSTGNPLPTAVLIGTTGVLPPTENGPGNTFGNALLFYESMEGMRVTVQAPLVVQDTNSFGETWVLASGGAGATGVDSRGGITISAGDLNPERIQIDNDANLSPGYNPTHTQGDILADVTGIMNYANSSYEVLVTGTVATTTDVTLPQETTTLHGDSTHLTVASYNVENLDLGDGQGKFDILAGNIVYNLLAPDIIALQEIQDADGPGNGSDLSGVVTAQALIDAIKAIGGPNYVYIEIAPTTAGSTGGEPGGNIRNGFLYNADRVGLVAGSVALIDDSAFSGSRKPLVATFTFNSSMVTLIDVHFTSRLGSDELEGANQPPTDAGDTARTAMGQAVRNYVNSHLATDPSLKIGVFGDFNGFYFEGAVGALEAGGVMTDLHRLLPPEERYSYVFDGNSQAIDQAVVTQNLASGAQFDPVHLNSEYLSNANRPTDHDPILASFLIPSPDGAINGTPGNDNPTATTGNDLFNVSQGGNDTVNGNDGDDYIYFGNAFTAGDSVDGGAGTDTLALLGNYAMTFDSDSLVNIERLALLSGTAIGGSHVTYNLTTIDDNVGAGKVLTVLGGGLQSDETMVFNGSAETDGSFYVAGGAADDILVGGQKDDALVGNGGDDALYGLAGNDWLQGGAGADMLRGGTGRDLFVYKAASDSTGAATDHIVDFEYTTDHIDLSGIDADSATAGDQAFTFIGSDAFNHVAGQLRAYQSGSDWFVEGDVDGDGAADLVIQVTVFNGHVMAASDFVL